MPLASPILPPAWLGVLGGGQLGRYFVIAARNMGYRVAVLDPHADSPAGALADRHIAAQYDQGDALDELAGLCVAVTTEFENVPAQSLSYLARRVRVAPSSECVAVAQDRTREKAAMRSLGFPVGEYAAVEAPQDLARPELYPAILKTARLGYDGKGQARVADPADAEAAWSRFGRVPCVLEKRLALEREVSAIVARGADGETRAFPVAENRHRNGILDASIVPAGIAPQLANDAQTIAARLAEGLGYEGVLAVEFFVVEGRLFVNEIAPRPHNSGHYTLDACPTSQYGQQVRALCGLPLGDARLLSPATMVNILGDAWHDGEPDWTIVLREPAAKLYLYGKSGARPGRKMGHFTVLGEQASAAALRIRSALGIEDGDGH
ncbi:MAG TPA: 5-(carboxyamino)imidazole ribonucleotide synthase [Burkholderiales bacterium]|nr:5-(carboxyamino)imidazole ribonucleotide synthase [Burkholderiales bacterium]